MKPYPDYSVYKPSDLSDLLRYSAATYGEKAAFQTEHRLISFREFEKDVLSVAAALRPLCRSFLLLLAADSYAFAVGFFAIVVSGNVAVLANPRHLSSCVLPQPIEKTIDDAYIREGRKAPTSSYEDYAEPDADQLCTVIYSSGTTSAAKGVMLSHRNLCCNAVGGLEKYRFSEEDRLVQLLPYFHAFGLVCDLLAPLLAGTLICCLDRKERFFSLLPVYKPSILNVPPAVAESLLRLADQVGDMDRVTGGQLRKLLCGGAFLQSQTTEALQKWGVKALGCYGITECSPAVCVNRDEYYKPGSAGIPLNCCTVRIAEDGEIVVRGDNVMLGYYGDLEKTHACIRDGEFYTGDLGFIDADGFLFVTGRKSNMIVFTNGIKVVPEEIEKMILAHPAVEDVRVYAEKFDGMLQLCVTVHLTEESKQIEVQRFIDRLAVHQPIYKTSFCAKPFKRTETGKLVR